MRKPIGVLFMGLGAALLVAALFLVMFNWNEDRNAGEAVDEILPEVMDVIAEPANDLPEDSAAEISAGNEFDPDMTVEDVDGYGYIGYLSIPALGLELPVMSEWDYTRLKIAPCRYSGSTKTDDLVICGHNFTRHFGTLKNLRAGDLVSFTDMDGVTTAYEVEKLETLQPAQISEMIKSDYSLTLYTCTYGGQSRVTVRCGRAETDWP